MAMIIRCPKCKHKLQISPSEIGRPLRCPNCNVRLVFKPPQPGEQKYHEKRESLSAEISFQDETLNGLLSPESQQAYKKLKELKGLIDGYQIIKLIAIGGMGLLFKGIQLSLNRTVAIKVLSSKYAKKEEFRRRFATEAALLARLRHPNIVNIIDRKEVNGLSVIVMEFVDGESLKDILLKRSVGINEMINIIVQIRNGLGYIHSQGIIHRDIKPSNILIDAMNNVKLADFGIAHIFRKGESSDEKPFEFQMGTPRYVAPEALSSANKIDIRSDIYSLAVTFYEMMTRVAFDRSLYKKPSVLNSALPEAVDDIIERALSINPEERYQHVTDFCQDLINALTGRRERPSPPAKKIPALPQQAFVLIMAVFFISVAIVFGRKLLFSKNPTPTQRIPVVHSAATSKKGRGENLPHKFRGETLLPAPLAGQHPDIPDHILITEVNVYEPEFIEIYNPTSQPIPLKHYYITDAIYFNGDYYLLPEARRIKGGDYYDFAARFPDDAVLSPGEAQTIAVSGSQRFLHQFGKSPTYELVEDDAQPDPIPDMIPVFPGSINPDPTLTTLSNAGESVILFYWDGTSDLVKDVDYVVWGDKEEAVCKTGKVCDGPDPDNMPSAYRPDTPILNQYVAAPDAPALNTSFQRKNLIESGEIRQGGNGITGHNETSERLVESFIQAPPTPGFVK
ncbi:protein kinase [Candidatus Sumerlaeota bacterium]|nr:protein kinase [Candidatus Sumerlaeota bacterium]